MSKWNRNALAEKMNKKLKESIEKADARAARIEKNPDKYAMGALFAAEKTAEELANIKRRKENEYKRISKKPVTPTPKKKQEKTNE